MAEGGRALAVQADVSDDGAVRALVAAVVDHFGGVDLLVNNAATTQYIALQDLDGATDEVWDSILALNVKGPFYCARAVAPHMRARGRGAIVNIGSIAGLTGDGSSLPCAVSKAAAPPRRSVPMGGSSRSPAPCGPSGCWTSAPPGLALS